MIPGFAQRRQFNDLSDKEILALAIAAEEDDARIYRTYADRLRETSPRRRGCSTTWRRRRTATAAG